MTTIPQETLQAAIFDWAGTTVDFGSRAPAEVFLEIFRRRGVEITVAEARGPMGRAKRDHIATVLNLPRVVECWQHVHGRKPTGDDVQRMYDDFLPLQKETLLSHADVIPGVVETVVACRQRGLKVGSTTGYTRELMEVVSRGAAAGGYVPDVVVCADDVAAGRPAPWMLFRAAERLSVYPMRSIVIVDDTPIGIEAGRHAGTWIVAVTTTGNAFGLSEAELAALPTREVNDRIEVVRRDFLKAGAHYVIDSVASLLPILDQIGQRLRNGETPS